MQLQFNLQKFYSHRKIVFPFPFLSLLLSSVLVFFFCLPVRLLTCYLPVNICTRTSYNAAERPRCVLRLLVRAFDVGLAHLHAALTNPPPVLFTLAWETEQLEKCSFLCVPPSVGPPRPRLHVWGRDVRAWQRTRSFLLGGNTPVQKPPCPRAFDSCERDGAQPGL